MIICALTCRVMVRLCSEYEILHRMQEMLSLFSIKQEWVILFEILIAQFSCVLGGEGYGGVIFLPDDTLVPF